MSESAIAQFPKCVAENICLWPSVADIHIRRIIQVGSLGFQNVPFGPVGDIIEYFMSAIASTPHPGLHQNRGAI